MQETISHILTEKIRRGSSHEQKLVVHFSASDVTAKVARMLANAVGADMHEIQPKVPYTKAALNWMNKKIAVLLK